MRTLVLMISANRFSLGIAQAFLCLVVFSILGCTKPLVVTTIPGKALGTTYNIRIADKLDRPSAQIQDLIDAEITRLDNIFSTYHDSELMQINVMPVGKARKISLDMREVITVVERVYHLSNHAFDPTVGRVVRQHGFGALPVGQSMANSVSTVTELVGWSHIQVTATTDDPIAYYLTRHADAEIDFSALAKGYIVDKVFDLLLRLNYNNIMVEIGGEVRAKGRKPGKQEWKIGIEKPSRGSQQLQLVVPLDDSALATSGDYRNYKLVNGKYVSHIIDPRTQQSVSNTMASVTVVAQTCIMADAMATAMMVLGREKSLEIAEQLRLPIYLLERDPTTQEIRQFQVGDYFGLLE